MFKEAWERVATLTVAMVCLTVVTVAYAPNTAPGRFPVFLSQHQNVKGSAGCAVTTPNVPDGPDPWGGCFPGTSNTGWSGTLTTYGTTGVCNITTPNVTIDSKIINCDVVVQSGGAGLTISNSQINGDVVQPDGVNDSFTIRDSVIDGIVSGTGTGHDGYACTNCGVGYRNFSVIRTEIMHTNRGAYCGSVCYVQDSYIHGQTLWPDDPGHPHASAVRQEQYSHVTHNSLFCDYKGPFTLDIGCSADQSGYPDFAPIHDNTFYRNLFGEGNGASGYCAYGGGTLGKTYSSDPTNATYQVYIQNVFQKGVNGLCGDFGHVTDFIPGNTGNTWSGNVFDDGTTAPSA